MSLIHEAVALLTNGHRIQAPASSNLSNIISLHQVRAGEYILHTTSTDQRFIQATHAVLSFRQLVGRAGLSHAVGELRYQALFPSGSSLGWPSIPFPKVASSG